jgi:hypothetical protein
LTVQELDLVEVPDLTGFLGEPPTGGFAVGLVDGTSEAVKAAFMVDRIRPGAVPWSPCWPAGWPPTRA